MSPSPQQFLSPLTSFFQDIGIHNRRDNRPAFVIEGNPLLPDPIGDIWQAEEASTAFEEGNLRSLSLGDNSTTTEGDSEEEDSEHKDDKEQGDETDDEDYNRLGVVFRNESPAPLVLCWLSENGEPHHFYRLGPLSDTISSLDPTSFEKLKTDHLENTVPGHAFCLGHVLGEEDLDKVRKSRSLIRNEIEQNGNGANKSNIVVAGYRPFHSKPSLPASPSSASSSGSHLSRHVQLVTITHVSPKKSNLRRIPWVRKKKACFPMGPWCLGRRKRLDGDGDCDSDDDHDIIPLDPRGWRVSARWVRFAARSAIC